GRSAELLRLREMLDTARSESRAALCTLVGAPGQGRTRLLAELALGAGSDVALLAAQCSPLASETNYGLVSALLRAGFQIAQGDCTDEIARKLAGGARMLQGSAIDAPWDTTELDGLAASIAIMLGASPEGAPSSRAASSEAGAGIKARLGAAVASVLDPIAADRPVLIVCDDLQW